MAIFTVTTRETIGDWCNPYDYEYETRTCKTTFSDSLDFKKNPQEFSLIHVGDELRQAKHSKISKKYFSKCP